MFSRSKSNLILNFVPTQNNFLSSCLQECVKRKALMSVLMVRDVELEKATKIVDKVFDKCYADLEPFGRIPRRNSRDPQRMLAEGRMYGYYN